MVAVAAQYVPAGIAAAVNRRAGRRGEACRVEPLRGTGVRDTRVAARNHVGAAAGSGVGGVTREQRGIGEAALQCCDSSESPTAQESPLNPVRLAKPGQLVDEPESEQVWHVEGRQASVQSEVVRVISAFAIVAGLVDVFRPGIRGQKGQPLIKAPFDLYLQRVINRGRGLLIPGNGAEVGKRPARLNGARSG